MKLHSSYSLLNSIVAGENASLPKLEPLIARWHGSRIRRIDRYIQLCVAGGLYCVGERSLAPATGLYLASRCGAVTTSSKAMVNTEHLGEMPKPLHFVNTLGNSAGYYLTHLLGLTGNTVVVSQEWLSFESALLHAWIDLHQGHVGAALVGGFDEVALPTDQHVERLGGGSDTAELTEGSHWLLLKRKASEPEVSLGQPVWLADEDDLGNWLSISGPFDVLQASFTPTSGEARVLERACTTLQAFTRSGLKHGVFSGAALVVLCDQLAEAPAGKRVLHLARGDTGPYCAVVVTR